MLDRTRLIDPDTGHLNVAYIAELGRDRATRELGPNFSPRDLRNAESHYRDIALHDRREWRKARGLPDDTRMVAFASYASDTNE